MTSNNTSRPLVAITSDLMIRNDRPTAFLTTTYASAVLKAGAIPVILPPMPSDPALINNLITRFDAFILSGGDDPVMEPFDVQTHPAITPVLEPRQSFETALLTQLQQHPQTPVLGICLGMQMLALVNHGALNQHLPDTHTSHATHWEHPHQITSTSPTLASGEVYSKHRQAVSDPGTLKILATAPDQIIEALYDPTKKHTLGVQWHPERTTNHTLGQKLFDDLIAAIESE